VRQIHVVTTFHYKNDARFDIELSDPGQLELRIENARLDAKQKFLHLPPDMRQQLPKLFAVTPAPESVLMYPDDRFPGLSCRM
jgi:hypothetical protein